MFLHCLDNLFRYTIIKLPPLKKVNFSTSKAQTVASLWWVLGNRGTRAFISEEQGN